MSEVHPTTPSFRILSIQEITPTENTCHSTARTCCEKSVGDLVIVEMSQNVMRGAEMTPSVDKGRELCHAGMHAVHLSQRLAV